MSKKTEKERLLDFLNKYPDSVQKLMEINGISDRAMFESVSVKTAELIEACQHEDHGFSIGCAHMVHYLMVTFMFNLMADRGEDLERFEAVNVQWAYTQQNAIASALALIGKASPGAERVMKEIEASTSFKRREKKSAQEQRYEKALESLTKNDDGELH